jgi:multimeric flavodoxin WrbA
MLVLGIYGSPRKGGNTDTLLDAVLEEAAKAGAEVEKVYCRRLKMSGCIECGGCDKTGQCVVDDDMQKVYPLLERAEAVVLAAPVFFYNVPAQCKALIDRSQACWAGRVLKKTTPEARRSFDSGRGYLVAVGATKGPRMFECMELTARYFYDALDMTYEAGMLLKGVEKKDGAASVPQTMDEARALGRKIVEGAA